MTLFLMPVIYAIFNRRADERRAKATARRDRLAAGYTRKQVKAMLAAGNKPAAAGTGLAQAGLGSAGPASDDTGAST
jgi:hypothetical protein